MSTGRLQPRKGPWAGLRVGHKSPKHGLNLILKSLLLGGQSASELPLQHPPPNSTQRTVGDARDRACQDTTQIA